jgi:O-succinylbenzoic acid--CoA ligase
MRTMLDWLKRHEPGRVFLDAAGESVTYGQMVQAVERRSAGGTKVIRPRLDIPSIIDLIAVMSSGSAVIAREAIDATIVDPRGAASVVFTSGTTGGPKGVRLTAGNWEAAAEASMRHLGHGPDDIWLLAMPLHHVAGLSIVLRSAYAGGMVRMLDDFEPAKVAAQLHGGVTMASLVPTMLVRVLEVESGGYDGVRSVLLGGGPIPDGLLERGVAAGLPLLPTYGLTETAGQVATLRPGDPPANKAHPLPGVELRIEPDGHIAIRGPMVSPGYVGEADREANAWLITEDVGSIDEDGALRVLGRADEVIVSGGENIDPGRVEAEIASMPGITRVLVLGVPSEEWGMEAVCLYVGDIEESRVESRLREALPGFMIPRRWLRVSELPMTPMGKPDRAAASRLFS